MKDPYKGYFSMRPLRQMSAISEAGSYEPPVPAAPEPELVNLTAENIYLQTSPEELRRKLLFHVKQFGNFQVQAALVNCLVLDNDTNTRCGAPAMPGKARCIYHWHQNPAAYADLIGMDNDQNS